MSKTVMNKGLYVWICMLLVIGMVLSLFLVYEHFSSSLSAFCTFSEGFDCGIVNKSPYANLDGISYLLTIDFGLQLPIIDLSGINVFFDFITTNAFLGFLTLLFVLFLLGARYKSKDFLWIEKSNSKKWLKGIMTFGVIYGFYLFLVQHFLLKTYCVFCLALDAVLVALLVMVWMLHE